MKKIGKGSCVLSNPVDILNWQAIVGQKEKEGPLGDYFDMYSFDEYFGKDTYEQAEAEMQKEVVERIYEKEKIDDKDIEFMFAGDLLNQCVGSTYGNRDRSVGYLGIYGACSTVVEGAIMSSMAVDGGFANKVLTVTGSHFCSAERQYRFPLEYGCQRPPSAQWTVTGSACFLLGNEKRENTPKITSFCVGKITDGGITDVNNMGAAMAPAAADTFCRYFKDTDTKPDDYDLILTGDLGKVGHSLVPTLLEKEGIKMGDNYSDCGMLIYDSDKQDVHSGGSGCGCCASVLAGYILPSMRKGIYRNILVAATGALMSPTVSLQGESILSIAHLINIRI